MVIFLSLLGPIFFFGSILMQAIALQDVNFLTAYMAGIAAPACGAAFAGLRAMFNPALVHEASRASASQVGPTDQARL
jgi:hypothetical protein